MPSTRDIRRRIKSVKNTRQITKAMELVAASKMKKAQQAAIAGRPYAILMGSLLAALAPHVNESEHPLLAKRTVKTRGILVITTDKGLCGPLNANLIKFLPEASVPAKYIAIGRKGLQYLVRTRRDVIADFTVSDRVGFSEVHVPVEYMMKLYLEGTIDTVEVVYSRFKNTLVQEPMLVPVLPLSSVAEFVTHFQKELGLTRPSENTEMLFEPNADAVLAALLPFYVHRQIYQFMLAAKASEHSSRMVAMKTAKDNATSLLGDLTLEYNKVRQAGITQEILEIAAASFSSN